MKLAWRIAVATLILTAVFCAIVVKVVHDVSVEAFLDGVCSAQVCPGQGWSVRMNHKCYCVAHVKDGGL